MSTHLDCVGVLGLRGVNGLACGFKVNFLAPRAGLSFDDADGGVMSLAFELPALELLVFTLP